ncbi:MAG: hypothetical protein LC650_02560, partial [Actinobacteria bacterium]|nr:hypothetical protein [Actinomycetota bacterium]
MVKVRTLKPHAQSGGLGVWARGQVYDETEHRAGEKARAGLVEYGDVVMTKESPELYRRMTVVPKVPDSYEEDVKSYGEPVS